MSELSTPKTITLFGRGKRRYPVVPGVWKHCIQDAREWKAWAAKVKDDRKWKRSACGLSIKWLARVLTTDVTELAKDSYRYMEMRAHLGNAERGFDRPARELWIKLGGRIRQPRKSPVAA